MSALDELLIQFKDFPATQLPPVENWHPPLSGDMDIVIRENGDWYHEGQMIRRPALVKLFSSILKKEGENFCLVSPVEKWRIRVEDAPLQVISVEILSEGVFDQQKICFKTSTDDVFWMDEKHPLSLRYKAADQFKPYIRVRSELDALISRSVFYRLADAATDVGGRQGVWSCGLFFALA